MAAERRAQKWWDRALRQLTALGATLEESTESNGSPAYRVLYEGHTHLLRNRSHVQHWTKRTRQQREEQLMSWADRHVLWMIANNCDDQGNPWPE